MNVPNDRKYAATHEWFLIEGDIVTIGITQHAADELTDITYVELPDVGSTVGAGAAFGEIESVKATSELVSVFGGTIAEVNADLADSPELVNDDPFGKAWMIKIKADSLDPAETLLDAGAYGQAVA